MTLAAYWLGVVYTRRATLGIIPVTNEPLADDPVTRRILAEAAKVTQVTGVSARAWQFADGSWLIAERHGTKVRMQKGAEAA